jgi:hypothetical protein
LLDRTRPIQNPALQNSAPKRSQRHQRRL